MTRLHRRTALAGLCAAALFLTGCGRRAAEDGQSLAGPPPLEVEVASVGTRAIAESLRLNGSLIPYRFANIVAEVDGVIDDIPHGDKVRYQAGGQTEEKGVLLDIGHRVNVGEVLVHIDPWDHELALKAARARLDLAQSELDKLKVWRREEERRQLKAQLEEATAQHEKCQADLQRAEQLHANRTISKEEYDRVSLAYSVARAMMERAQAAWDIAENGPTKEEIAMAEAQVALAKAEVETREKKVAKCTIRAPYDAVVTERYVGVGDRVTALPRVEILQIVDPSILFAQVSVPERYQGRIQVGDEAKVRVHGVTDRGRGPGQDFAPGIVGLVNSKIDPETRTFRVRVGLDNRDGLLHSGSFAQVELTVRSVPDAVAVPASALTFAEGRPSVFVLDGERVRRRGVDLGIASRNEDDPAADAYEVLSGLKPGERIVVGSAVPMLADGMAVQPREAKGSGPAQGVAGRPTPDRGGDRPHPQPLSQRERGAGLPLSQRESGALAEVRL